MRHPPPNYMPYCNTPRIPRTQRTERSNRRSHQPNRADKMLASIGRDRGTVYIANVVPWRPPGNRTGRPLETAACLPFTHRQIEIVDKIPVCLGAAAQT